MNYPHIAKELADILASDQLEKKQLARAYLHGTPEEYETQNKLLTETTKKRSEHVLDILELITEPSISNIGNDGALAISVLASHDPSILGQALDAFERLYHMDRSNCRYQSIPAMTDAHQIQLYKAQKFGTQWLFDENNYPFLYFVVDFESVNQRRASYDIEPLHWPKSLAVPESEQPWLQKPLSELTMRWPTDAEYKLNFG